MLFTKLCKHLTNIGATWHHASRMTKSRINSCEIISKEHIMCFYSCVLHTCWTGVFFKAVTHFHSCSRSLMASFFRPYFSLKLAASRTSAKWAADPGCGGEERADHTVETFRDHKLLHVLACLVRLHTALNSLPAVYLSIKYSGLYCTLPWKLCRYILTFCKWLWLPVLDTQFFFCLFQLQWKHKSNHQRFVCFFFLNMKGSLMHLGHIIAQSLYRLNTGRISMVSTHDRFLGHEPVQTGSVR